jgi:hypothetical protein
MEYHDFNLTEGLDKKSLSDTKAFLAKQKPSIYQGRFNMADFLEVYSLEMGLQSRDNSRKQESFATFILAVGSLFCYMRDCFSVAICTSDSEAASMIQLGQKPIQFENIRMLSNAILYFSDEPELDVKTHIEHCVPFLNVFLKEAHKIKVQNALLGIDVYSTASDNIRLPDEYYKGFFKVACEYINLKLSLRKLQVLLNENQKNK